MSSPFSIGYNGHAKSCDCKPCAKERVKALEAKVWRLMNEIPIPTADKPIFVRAHFRRGKYLTRAPVTRSYWRGVLQRWGAK